MGAKGFVIKNTDQDELQLAIKRVMGGGQYFSASLTMNLISQNMGSIGNSTVFDNKKALLTDREIEILKLIAEGLSNKEIGDKLFISHRTVDTHRTNLMKNWKYPISQALSAMPSKMDLHNNKFQTKKRKTKKITA